MRANRADGVPMQAKGGRLALDRVTRPPQRASEIITDAVLAGFFRCKPMSRIQDDGCCPSYMPEWSSRHEGRVYGHAEAIHQYYGYYGEGLLDACSARDMVASILKHRAV
jgi:hypothetical protein